MSKYTEGLKEISHVMRFEGKKCKEISKELNISLRLISTWMKDYDAEKVKEEQRIKNTPLPKPEKLGKVALKHLQLEALKENKRRDHALYLEAMEIVKGYTGIYEKTHEEFNVLVAQLLAEWKAEQIAMIGRGLK